MSMELVNKAIRRAKEMGEMHYLEFSLFEGISPSRANFILRQAALADEQLVYEKGVLKVRR